MGTTEPAQAPGWGLFAQWHALIDAGDPRFTMLSTVLDVAEPMATAGVHDQGQHVERAATPARSVRCARRPSMSGLRRRKGVELRYILPRRVAERRCPLATSYDAGRCACAPVAHPLMVGDRRWILVGDSTGETVWTSSDPGVVAGRRLLRPAVEAAEPAVPEGQDPPVHPADGRHRVPAGRRGHGPRDRPGPRGLGANGLRPTCAR